MINDERGPTVPPVSEDRVGVLAAYVRTNRDRFTDEALRGASRAAGYTDAEITAAWSAAAAPISSVPTEGRTKTAVVIVTAVAYAVVLYATAGVLGSIGVGDLAAWAGLGLVLAGIIGWVQLRESKPSLAAGLGWGVLVVVVLPVVVVLGILGICLVGGGAFIGG